MKALAKYDQMECSCGGDTSFRIYKPSNVYGGGELNKLLFQCVKCGLILETEEKRVE